MRPAFEAALSLPWAIWQPALQTILAIAADEPPPPEALARWKHHGDPAALAARQGQPLAGARHVTIRDGVAVVSMVGPVFRRANLMTEHSGATSLEMLAADFAAAVASPQVQSILLDVDSPGGEANGVAEFAAMVRASPKPVTAYVGGTAASAGYWVAAAAHEVVVARTAWLGSIGVVMAHRDTSERDARSGVKTVEFVSSQSPAKRLDPATDAGRAAIQARIDRLADEFVAAVAGYRGVAAEDVLAKFGAGDVLIGADAVAAGMADRLGDFESILAAMAARVSTPSKGSLMTEQTTIQAAPPAVTLATLAASHPDLVTALRAEGAKVERERILGIQAAALPGHDALVAKCIADGVDLGATATMIMAAEKARAAGQVEALRTAEPARVPQPAANPAGGATAKDPMADDGRPLEDRCKAAFEADARVRDEFKTLATFTAAMRVEAANQARRR